MMQDYLAAASKLIESLNAPPQVHAIWVHTAVNPETKEFVHTVRAAIHPDWKRRITLPKEIDGKTVTPCDWVTCQPLEAA